MNLQEPHPYLLIISYGFYYRTIISYLSSLDPTPQTGTWWLKALATSWMGLSEL